MCLSHLRWDKILTKSASRLVPRLRRGARFASYQVKKRGPFSQGDFGKIVICLSHLSWDKILTKKCFQTSTSGEKTRTIFPSCPKEILGKSSYVCPISAGTKSLRKSASRLVHQVKKRGPFFQVVRRRFRKIVICLYHLSCMKILVKKCFRTSTPASPGRSLRELSGEKTRTIFPS